MDEQNIPSQAPSQGTIIGDQNRITQTFNKNYYDRTGRDWNTRLIAVSDLRSESFNLGDAAAAKFPYVVSPIEDCYHKAIQALHDASSAAEPIKYGMLVLGEANAGKTRLALETLKQVLPIWPLLRWHPNDTTDDAAPPVEFLNGKQLVLFIDDLQDYVPAQLSMLAGQLSIMNPRASTLRSLIEVLLQTAQRVVIVATCRIENKSQVQAELNQLFLQLVEITLPSFNADAQDPQSAQTIAEFQKQGVIQLNDWDGTLGSLVLGLSRKHSQYLVLVEGNDPAARVLCAMKLLSIASITTHTEQRLRAVCSNIFGAKQLLADDAVWQNAIDQLTGLQFVTEKVSQGDWNIILLIRKDVYFEQVVTDYPPSNLPIRVERDLVRLQRTLIELKDVDGLRNLSLRYGLRERYEEALSVLEQALTLDPKDAVAWRLKGWTLDNLGRAEEALPALEQALTLNPKDGAAWRLKGYALNSLGRYEEALPALEQAITLKDADAWGIKGYALDNLGRYEEALSALEQALTLNPNNDSAKRLKDKALARFK